MEMEKPEMSYQMNGYKMAFMMAHEDKELIEDYYNLFFNHGAVDVTAKLYWVNEERAYFWTDEERMLKALTNIYLHRIMSISHIERSNLFKGESGAGKTLAAKLGKEAFNKITRIAGVFKLSGGSNEFYSHRYHQPE